MRFEIGKEIEFARHRITDIIFLAEQTVPSHGNWEEYSRSIRRLISDQAREAETALRVLK